MELTRREFVKSGLALVSMGLTVPSVFTQAVYAAGKERGNSAAREKTLAIIQVAGGNDGLNTVIPYADSAYRENRPGLGIDEKDILRLDGQIGFHPSLARFKELWDEGRLAIIEGVGYPNPNRSHFRSMEIWQSANPDGSTRAGWLGRYFDEYLDKDGHVFKGINIGNGLPLSLVAAQTSIPSVAGIESYRLLSPGKPGEESDRTTTLLKLYSMYPASSPYAALLDTTATEAYKSSLELQKGSQSYTPALEYPKNSFGNGLRILAQIVSQEIGARVCHIAVGGYDTHANQKTVHANNLTALAEGLHAFYKDLEAHGKADDVLIMTWSEFGRRVKENASNGTDHGTAGPMFLIGGQVKAGAYGEPPSLTALDDGDLKFTTDFRSVYATVLEKWLGATAPDVLGSNFPLLDFV